ncbi:phage protein Gp37 [Stutzerimonas nitrititolerans]|uniref:phage protein Gp37 n=1 Tax=Stutzerimonas nitrititolerans TaxID=2482751 RepID=UPI0028ADB2CA|nr:phage protein Gp37 [Stutzerimonas nitrititolerans]
MLAEVEDAIIERCERLVGNHVKTIEDLPGNWDEATLKAAKRKVPGIYIAWSGGAATKGGRAAIDSRYAVYIVTGQASGERARRRGNNREVGAYEILERVVPGLHGLAVAGVGTLQLERVDNLYSDRADQQGIVIYGAAFALAKMMFPAALDASELADFAIFHANHQVPDGPDTETHLTLPTGSEEQP